MDLSLIQISLLIMGFFGGILLISFLAMYYLWPSLLIRIGIWYKRQKNSVKIKYAKCKDYTFCYICRGNPGPQPSMLLLHGFSASKDMWLELFKGFPKDLHVICVDMPGHGGTTRREGESYTGVDQVARIHQFVECVGLNRKPFHLVGISMGGMVAGLYAAYYPSEVLCLSLFCPAGLQSPTTSEYMKHMKSQEKSSSENNPLIPSSVKQTKDLIKLGIYQDPPKLGKQLIKGYLDYQKPHNAFYKKYNSGATTNYNSKDSVGWSYVSFADISNEGSRFLLHDNLTKIKAPMQVIWGKDDKIIDPSGAEVLAAAFPSSQVHMLERCGHFIVGDRPRKSVKLLLEFNNSFCNPSESKKMA